MKQGIPLGTTIYAPQRIPDLNGFTNCAGSDVGSWDVRNAGDSERGTFNLVTGTWYSVNTFFAQLEKRTGLCEPVRLAEAMGVRPATGGHISQYPTFTLGAADTYSPLDVAGAYATVAAHGRYCRPTAITKVTDQDGHNIRAPQPGCEQVLESGLADTITSILNGVLTKPGATAANVGEPGRPAAAKTGTAENDSASDFAGFVPQMAAAVWVGDPKNPNRPLNFLTIGGRHYSYVYGATIAGPIWHDTMVAALRGVPVEPLPEPDPEFVHGITKPVPDVAGLSVKNATSALEDRGFHVLVGAGCRLAAPGRHGRADRPGCRQRGPAGCHRDAPDQQRAPAVADAVARGYRVADRRPAIGGVAVAHGQPDTDVHPEEARARSAALLTPTGAARHRPVPAISRPAGCAPPPQRDRPRPGRRPGASPPSSPDPSPAAR